MQSEYIQEITFDLLNEARKKLSRPVISRYGTIDREGHAQGETFLCPLCLYQSKKHPKGSAVIKGNRFKCFSCGASRGVNG